MKTVLRMMHALCFFLPILFLATGCQEAVPAFHNAFDQKDTIPPSLVSSRMISPASVELVFSEKVDGASARVSLDGHPASIIQKNEWTLEAVTGESVPGGHKALVEMMVQDTSWNSSWAQVPVWGYNPNPAGLIINEFTTKGTEKQPDRVELYVYAGGSLAGITLSDGHDGDWADRCILPDLTVEAGIYLVISFQPPFTAASQEEDYEALSFLSENQKGLASANGILILAASPEPRASIIDCAVYASHTKSAHGFGSENLYRQVQALVQEGAWVLPRVVKGSIESSTGAIDSTGSTSTRSFCRRKEAQEKASPQAWYICDTKESSFGAENSTKEWVHP